MKQKRNTAEAATFRLTKESVSNLNELCLLDGNSKTGILNQAIKMLYDIRMKNIRDVSAMRASR
jgi:hypothetical protein